MRSDPILCDAAWGPSIQRRPVLALALGGMGVSVGEAGLVPVGIGAGNGAGGVQSGDLFRSQIPADCTQVLL